MFYIIPRFYVHLSWSCFYDHRQLYDHLHAHHYIYQKNPSLTSLTNTLLTYSTTLVTYLSTTSCTTTSMTTSNLILYNLTCKIKKKPLYSFNNFLLTSSSTCWLPPPPCRPPPRPWSTPTFFLVLTYVKKIKKRGRQMNGRQMIEKMGRQMTEK